MRLLVILLFLGIESSKIESDYYDVVIIGSGSSGIGAAIQLLSQSNLTITLLEARDRVGGRAYTNKHSLHFPFDIGAEWIHSYTPQNPLYPFHQQLQTVLDEDRYIQLFDPASIACYDSDGSIVSPKICTAAQETLNRLFSRLTLNESDADVSVHDVIREDYDRLDAGPLKRLVRVMLVALEELFAADLDQLSAKEYLNNPNWSIEAASRNNLALKRGYGFFLERIADHYRLPIVLNTVIDAIDTFSHNDMIRISTSQGRKIVAKYVIVTIPLGCLKQRTIHFQPSLPQWKLDAIDQLGYGSTDKIILQFDAVFWNENSTILYLADAPFPFVLCNPTKRILSFMIGGRSARAMENETDETTVERVISSLQQAFPQQQFKFERYVISRWSQDEFARGSYTFFKPNSSPALMELLAKECADNRLFWAGEHTSDGQSVHTAFITGQREANKILDLHRKKSESFFG